MDTETAMTLTPASAQDSIASVEEFSSIMDSTFKNLKSRFDKSSGDILSKSEACSYFKNGALFLPLNSGGTRCPNGRHGKDHD